MPSDYAAALIDHGFLELQVSMEHAVRATALPALHGAPFDRVLVAPTLLERMVLITRDAAIRRYELPCVEG